MQVWKVCLGDFAEVDWIRLDDLLDEAMTLQINIIYKVQFHKEKMEPIHYRRRIFTPRIQVDHVQSLEINTYNTSLLHF